MSGEEIDPIHLKWSDFTSKFVVEDGGTTVIGPLTALHIIWTEPSYSHSRQPAFGLVAIKVGGYDFEFVPGDHKKVYRGRES